MWEKKWNVYEYWKTRLVRLIVQPGMIVVDVGANVGYYTFLCARLVGTTGKVIAFEPHPALLEWLRRGQAINRYINLELSPFALSDSVGSVDFYEGRISGWGSICFAQEAAATDLVPFQVPTTTLDAFLAQRPVTAVDLIKIDVEDAEAMVVRGALDTLARESPILLIDVDLRTFENVLLLETLLRDSNYRLYSIGSRFTELDQIRKGLKDILAVRGDLPFVLRR